MIKPPGAKDWSPSPTPASLLPKEDLERIARIRQKLALRLQSWLGSVTDIQWLCDRVEALGKLTPLSGEFHEWVALINPFTCQAIPLRFKRHLRIRRETTLPQDGPFSFEHKIETTPTDADLLVRPYVRLLSPSTEAAMAALGKATLSVRIKGASVLEADVDEYLTWQDGQAWCRNLYRTLTSPSKDFYYSAALYDDVAGWAQPEPPLGIFVTHGDWVEMALYGGTFEGPVRAVVGMVAARYTTQAAR